MQDVRKPIKCLPSPSRGKELAARRAAKKAAEEKLDAAARQIKGDEARQARDASEEREDVLREARQDRIAGPLCLTYLAGNPTVIAIVHDHRRCLGHLGSPPSPETFVIERYAAPTDIAIVQAHRRCSRHFRLPQTSHLSQQPGGSSSEFESESSKQPWEKL